MSREAELYKDKIEVSLDGRQIFYLFFGGSVIVGLVFVLGVMVGRRVEARGHVDRARVAATVDPLAALDRLEGGNGLSFQGALRGGEAPASDIEKQIAAMEAKPLDGKAAKKPETKTDVKSDAKVESPKVEAKADVKTEAKTESKTDAKTESKKSETKTDAKTTDSKTDAKTESKKSETKTDSKTTDAKTESKKSETKTDSKTTDAKSDTKTEAKKSETKTEDKKRYTVQLSAFQEKGDAETLAASVKAAGYEAYISEGTVDGKQYFRVRTGTYKTQEAANEAKAELEKVANKSAIVTKL